MEELLRIYPKNSSILLVGPYPPPLGGVSVHIERLVRILTKNGYEVDVFNTSEKCKLKSITFIELLQVLLCTNHDIIHIHTPHIKKILLFLLIRYLKQSKIYYTDHNPRLFEKNNSLIKCIGKKFIMSLDYLVVVGDHILETYNENKVKLPKNILVRNAFLPPPLEDEDRIIQTYSDETNEFIKRHKPIVIANAFQIAFYKNADLYGLDTCVELTHKLKQRYRNVGFLFALANEKVNSDYVNKIKKTIKDLEIDNNFHFLTGQKELWPLFKKADLSIRPTRTDGDALSIRESLHFNCPIVASDAVVRPEGTTLYKFGDIDNLYSHVCEILGSPLST